MLRINQTKMDNVNALIEAEKVNHTDGAFEYLPFAKEQSYESLAKGRITLFLSIKITDNNGEQKEKEIIEGHCYLAMIACATRVFNRHKDVFETLSISFKQSLNKLRSEGIFINALLVPKSQNLLSNLEIVQLENEIAQELDLIPKEPKPKQNLKPKSEVVFKKDKIKQPEASEKSNGNQKKMDFKKNEQKPKESIQKAEIKKKNISNATIKTETIKKENNINEEKTVEKQEINTNNNNEESSTGSAINNMPSPTNSMKIHKVKGFDAATFLRNAKNAKVNAAKPIKEKSTNKKNKDFIENIIKNEKIKTDIKQDAYHNHEQKTHEHECQENQKLLEKSSMTSTSELATNVNTNTNTDVNNDVNCNSETTKTSVTKNDANAENIETEKEVKVEEETKLEAMSQNDNMKKETIDEADETNNETNINPDSVPDSSNSLETSVLSESMKNRLKELAKDQKAAETLKNKNKDEYSLSMGDINFTQKNNDEDLKLEENEPFIKDFFTTYGKENIPESQKKAYLNATDSSPFLNNIDNYVPTSNIEDLEEPAPVYEIHEADEFIQTTASKHKIKKAFEKTMRYFMENEATTMRRVLRGEVDENNFLYDVQEYVKKYCQIPLEDMDVFMDKLKRAMFSYYVLTPAINDPNISDIRVLAPNNINVKVHGDHFIASDLKFIDQNDYIRFIESLIIKNRVPITNAILVFTDKEFHPDYILRFNLCLPDINSTGLPYLHIRKVPKKKTTMKDLIKAGMLDYKIAAYILDKIRTSRGIVISGPSASGKSTLQNAMVDYIPKEKSILCIQESEEMFSHIHPNAYFQHMLKDSRGNTVIGLSELGQNGLLCDVGYFIIGECKGAEVRDLLRASNTGHKCWCTVHAQSSKETISRLADYVKYGSDYSFKEAVRMLKDLEVIIYIENFKVKEISEIAGYDEDKEEIIYRSIYKNPQFFNIESEKTSSSSNTDSDSDSDSDGDSGNESEDKTELEISEKQM